MMHAGKRAIEHAEAMVALECDVAINRIRATLAAPGSVNCGDCGDAIDAGRRAALPSVRRCVSCEEHREMRKKRGW